MSEKINITEAITNRQHIHHASEASDDDILGWFLLHSISEKDMGKVLPDYFGPGMKNGKDFDVDVALTIDGVEVPDRSHHQITLYTTLFHEQAPLCLLFAPHNLSGYWFHQQYR